MKGRLIIVSTIIISIFLWKIHRSPCKETMHLALINGTLIDGTGSDPIPNAIVVMQKECIIKVGERDKIDIPVNAEIIDVKGATILPGFFNTHVHIPRIHYGSYEPMLKGWARDGVTTVGDLAGPTPFALRDKVPKDNRDARLIEGSPIVNTVGGYHSQVEITSPADASQKVNKLIDAGADIIKIMIEDRGVQRKRWPMLTTETVSSIVNTAHKRGIPVSAHVSRSKYLKIAIDTGVDDVAHMTIDNCPDEYITGMIEKDIYWVPTLEVWKCVSKIFKRSSDIIAIDNLRRFANAGGKVALGTDFNGYGCEFDLGMPMTEIELMQKAGMTPMQIIVAGTQHGAHVCNLDQELGTIEKGKIADIMVVEGNPLNDIQLFKNVRIVIHNGEIIRRERF